MTADGGANGQRGLDIAHAAVSGGDPGARFQSIDANGDGQVSSDEWTGPEAMFRMLDANGDGFLTFDEMRSGRGQRP